MDLRGRYVRANVKQVVEDCLRLEVRSLGDALAADTPVEGRLAWADPGGGAGASLEFAVEPLDGDRARLHLRYGLGDEDAPPVEEDVNLVATAQHFGGKRWSFLCPLDHDGHPCGRVARVLYLPPGQRYFGCRECHQLSYTSRQQRPGPGHPDDAISAPPAAVGLDVGGQLLAL